MDPWLESYWGDVHHELISELRRQAVPQLPPDLFAVVGETVYVVGDDWGDQTYKPDVGVIGEGPVGRSDRSTSGATALAEPLRLTLATDPVTEGHVEIRRLRDGHPLVTAIQVLSPKNKIATDGRAAYLEKRRSYQQAGVTLMEVDLLRAGRDMVGVANVERLDARLPSAYRCTVRRWSPGGATHLELYPLPLRERLPAVALPLRPTEPPITLDLQLPIDSVYQLGGYGRRLDYSRPPDPRLSPDDAAWAAGCVAAANR